MINGFTRDTQTRKGTFHIINFWAGLEELKLATEAAAGGALVIEESLLPFGELETPVAAPRNS